MVYRTSTDFTTGQLVGFDDFFGVLHFYSRTNTRLALIQFLLSSAEKKDRHVHRYGCKKRRDEY